MKMKRGLLGISGVLLLSMVTAGSAMASVVNMGFENGTTGWDITLNGGSAEVLSSYEGYAPVEGNSFLVLGGGTANKYVKASQTFYVGAHETVSGNAAFIGNDYLPFNDLMTVTFKDADSEPIYMPILFDIKTVGDYGKTPWTPFSWTSDVAGEYTLNYAIKNVGDAALPSYALFDGPSSGSPTGAVPLPGSVMLFGSSLLGLLGVGSRKKNKA
ncbi:MAG: hypothetical protein OEV89_10855 [Desulfobulbaceae bacterium]|nr:hypothetical protein [Desulfobulbaceae bacterium]HIJ91187.1 hypothetical protein [Deltaproteobacteria bacterium]